MRVSLKLNLIISILILFVILISFTIYSLTPKQVLNYVSETQDLTRKQSNSEISLTFAGDVMLGRLVGHRHQEGQFVDLIENFDTKIFEKADIAWVNLEGPISNMKIKQNLSPDNLNFLFSRQAINALKNLHINLVGLANNHTFNSGSNGLKTTQEFLDKNGINWHGLPTKIDEESVYRFSKEDINLSLIAVHTLYDGSALGIDNIIRSEKEKGFFVIVLPHWGEEYQTTHSVKQEGYAKHWADAGADIIIGTHPHVVQDSQIIKGDNDKNTLVFYSLGNFIFDQTFSEETQLGLILKMNLNSQKLVSIELVPIESVDLKPQYASVDRTRMIIERVCENIQSYCDLDNTTIQIQF